MEAIFYTDNSEKFNTRLKPGQCMGMSCDWAKVSLTLPTVHFDALTPAKWDIGQSAYEINKQVTDVKIIEAFGMEVTNGNGAGERRLVSTGEDVATHLANLPGGTYVWGLVGPGGGHALGFRRTADGYELFDPNFGLERTADRQDFIDEVKERIKLYYTKLLEKFDVFQVTAA